MDQVPLIILSADRPMFMVGTGANQTIDQEKLYGKYPRYFAQLPLPDLNRDLQDWKQYISQALQHTGGNYPGPVHLNCPFDEPLLERTAPKAGSISPEQIFEADDTYTLELDDWIGELATVPGAIIAGRLPLDAAQTVLKLSSHLNWPIIPDILSQLRLQKHPNILNYSDLMTLGSGALGDPQLLLQFGGPVVSRRIGQWIAQGRFRAYVQVHPAPIRLDPSGRVTRKVTAPYTTVIDALMNTIPKQTPTAAQRRVAKNQAQVADVIDEWSTPAQLDGLFIAQTVSRLQPESNPLVLASSLPIREFDWLSVPRNNPPQLFANRGASGIDGTIATACGIARGADKPVTLVIGDLAFLHDLNSLSLVAASTQPLIIVVVNNDGGGIFHHLPIKDHTDVFEEFFGTPHGFQFSSASKQFGIKYSLIKSPEEFESGFKTALRAKTSRLLEVRTSRKLSEKRYSRLLEQVRLSLNQT
jgi:2-succinyl-5-enolpyruvyl-6-hydroxy-3-cyclohexene-1-carboxylate synthase